MSKAENFQLVSDYEPKGDQPKAVDELTANLHAGKKFQVLLGVTGSGKTFTIANTIANINKPTIIISHNKTLSAQLFGELREYFPHNAVEYFISYYDYYQPEAYIPETDTYIEKDTDVNEDINRLRLRATASLMSRRDVVIVSSVSCIYGLGSPLDYEQLLISIEIDNGPSRSELLQRLIQIHYRRNDFDFQRGVFRVRGDVIEIYPAYHDEVVRVEYWDDTVEKLSTVHPLTGEVLKEKQRVDIYPAKHFVTERSKIREAVKSIEQELQERIAEFQQEGNLLAAQRIEQRTRYDIEMLMEIGYCTGIENYSRHISGRAPGSRPYTLLDYFPDDFLVIIDESHMTIPQIKGMYRGDRSRKLTLVEHGFRLPSALDNRPLYFEEFDNIVPQMICMSATPSDWELTQTGGEVVEQLVRPTGLVDPKITVKPSEGQIEDVVEIIQDRVARNERVLITTLTKRMAEDLAGYLAKFDFKARYLHSEIDTLERVEILRDLRIGEFDILVGINLLREGLDLPEVTTVVIFDADKQGFLRSRKALIQTAGRSARNIKGEVILYADKVTDAMREAIDETTRRRQIQLEYNKEHGIEPKSIIKSADSIMRSTQIADMKNFDKQEPGVKLPAYLEDLPFEQKVDELTRLMESAAKNLDFEFAAFIKGKISKLKEQASQTRKARIEYINERIRKSSFFKND